MRRYATTSLFILGSAITLGGLAFALIPVANYYSAIANSPLETPPGEAALSRNVRIGGLVCAAGLPLFIAGKLMLSRDRVRRRHRRGR